MTTPTSVCTMKTLLERMLHRNSYTLMESSTISFSNMLSSKMNAPVRPTPALQWTSMGGLPCLRAFLTCLMKLINEVAKGGTPWSGQPRKCQCVTVSVFSLSLSCAKCVFVEGEARV